MSNDALNDFSVAFNNLLQTAGTLVQQEITLVTLGVKTASELIGPVVKIPLDLVGNIFNNVGHTVQNVVYSCAPKQ